MRLSHSWLIRFYRSHCCWWWQ